MENEINSKDNILNEKLVIANNNIFKYDYEKQNLDNNLNYLKWKDSFLKEYGITAKLFKCKKCKILFYSKNEDIIKKPYYLSLCPICKHYIFYFCSYSYNFNESLFCCNKRAINISIFSFRIKLYKRNN